MGGNSDVWIPVAPTCPRFVFVLDSPKTDVWLVMSIPRAGLSTCTYDGASRIVRVSEPFAGLLAKHHRVLNPTRHTTPTTAILLDDVVV